VDSPTTDNRPLSLRQVFLLNLRGGKEKTHTYKHHGKLIHEFTLQHSLSAMWFYKVLHLFNPTVFIIVDRF
jgi:hypothetical protein